MKLLLAVLLVLRPLALDAQNEQDLAEGKAIFRSNCAFCHGLTGRGGRGPALVSRQFLHGSSDEDIKAVVRNGVPGTDMPAYENMEPEELTRLVGFIRSLGGAEVHSAPVPGDAARGREIYARRGCAGCHRIGSQGSVFGPDLTRIGAGRSREYIRESVLDPSVDIPPEFEGVTVVTREGRRITGIRVNEDTFSVQLRDPSGAFRMFQKEEVREVIHQSRSLMPPYSLPPAELTDLLAYLDSLRGQLSTGAEARKAKGIQ